MRYRDYDLPEDHGYIHENDLPDLNFLCLQFEKLIEAVYDTGSTFEIEKALHEIGNELEVAVPNRQVAIEKRELSNHLQWYLGYHRCMLDNRGER